MHILEQIGIAELSDERLSFFRAIGVDSIHLELRGGKPQAGVKVRSTGAANSTLAQALRAGQDCTEELENAREQIESHGLKLNNVFMSAWQEITLDEKDADEKIGYWCQMLESLGRAGIPCLGWNFKPMGNFRTTSDVGRGGVQYSTFDYEAFDANRPVPHEPPIPEPLGGVAQICSTLAQFRRTLFEIAPSHSNAMLFCQGCMTELLGPEGIYDAIAEMASADKIAWVHFRNVRGQLPRFTEVFMDEGEVDMKRAMEVYRDNGFNGPYMMDHTPHFPHHDNLYGKAYAIGYIRALIQTVYGG